MSSQARIDASRANGKLSRGPKTEEGKRRSSQNARRHGLLSLNLPTEGECAARFAESRQRLIDEFNPQDEIERALVDSAALNNWRFYEALRFHTALINDEMRAQLEKHPELADEQSALRQFLALQEICKRSNILQSLHRYTFRFEWSAARDLETLRQRRKMQISETNLTFKRRDTASRGAGQ